MRKNKRVTLEIPSAVRDAIAYAAKLTGRPIKNFILTSACMTARDIIKQDKINKDLEE